MNKGGEMAFEKEIARFKSISGAFYKYPGDRSIRKIDAQIAIDILNLTSGCAEEIGLQARVKLLELGLTTTPFCPICKEKLLRWKDGYWMETCGYKCTCMRDYGVSNIAKVREKQEKRINSDRRTKFIPTLEDEIEEFKSKERYHGDRYITTNYPFLVAEALKIEGKYPLQGKIQLVLIGSKKPPICSHCNEKWCIWSKSSHSWMDVCSKSCSVNKTYINEKERILDQAKKTWQRNLGVNHPQKSSEVKLKMEETNLLRYGNKYQIRSEETQAKIRKTFNTKFGGHPFANVEIKLQLEELRRERTPEQLKLTSERRAESNLRIYGTPTPAENLEVRNTMKRSTFEKFGVTNVMKDETIRAKHLRKCQESFGFFDRIMALITSRDFWQVEYFEKEKTLEQIARELGISPASAGNYFNLLGFKPRDYYVTSFQEKELGKFLNLHTEIVPQLGIGDKSSVDVYLPEYKIAIEHNGIYWHSEEYREEYYHINKTKKCENLGIRLIHVWEDDWEFHQSIVKKKLLHILGLADEKIYARRCKTEIPTEEEKKDFYNLNHIQGDGIGSVSYSLVQKNTTNTVAMMTFMEIGDGVWDLNRYASSIRVPGGFSKLLAEFTKKNKWNQIITYSDLSWSKGNLYEKNGFHLDWVNPPTFHGIERNHRVNRWHYTIEKLKKRFPNLWKEGISKFDLMDKAKILRIWDCGTKRYSLLR